MKKRLVSWLLAVCMVVSLLPSVVLADNSAWTTWTTADSTHVQVETPASYEAKITEAAVRAVGFTGNLADVDHFLYSTGNYLWDTIDVTSGSTIRSDVLYMQWLDKAGEKHDLQDGANLMPSLKNMGHATLEAEAVYSATLPSDAAVYSVMLDDSTDIVQYAGGSKLTFAKQVKFAPMGAPQEDTYAAAYVDQNGRVISMEQVKVGEQPANAPTQTANGSAITGWDPALDAVEATAGSYVIYTAQYATYRLTLNATHAVITGVDVNRAYEAGETVDYYAYPEAGYELANAGKNTYTVVAGDNTITVTATAIPVTTYPVSVQVSNNAYGTASAEATAYAAGQTVYVSAKANQGYYIAGYAVTSDGQKVTYTQTSDGISFTMPAAPVEVLVLFRADAVYTVTYDVPHGAAIDAAQVKGGESITLPTPDLDDGYSFVIWKDGKGGFYQAGDEAVITENTTFTALVRKNEYTVKFVADDRLVDLQLVEAGEQVAFPQLTKDGYDLSWRIADCTCGGDHDVQDPYTVTEDITFELQQTPQKVKLNKIVYVDGVEYNGDVSAVFGSGVNVIAEAETGTTVSFQLTAKTGYYFKALTVMAGDTALTANLSALEETDGGYTYTYQFTMPAEETTISLYFVTDMNNTSMVKFIDSQTGALLDLQLVAYGSAPVQPADPFKAGYEFTGWYNEAGEPFDFAKTVDTAVTLVYAKFAAENYTLQFDTAGGTPSYIAAIQTQYGALEQLPADVPTRDGYTFLGWKDKATGFVYDAGATYHVTASAEFVAVWEKDGQAIVKFVDPDGFLYDWTFAEGGSDITLPAEPTKAGFTFRGWERENGDVFGAGQTVTVNGAPGEVIVFTAKWEGAAYTLHIQSRNASGKLTADGATYDIPDDSVASIVAGEPVELTVNPDADYVVSSVYYTTKVGAVTNKVLIEADENGVYRFTMPGADAWLHIETMRNVFRINTASDGHATVTAASQNPADRIGTATAGSMVVVNVKADDGYAIDSVIATSESGFVYLVYGTTLEDGTKQYAFCMPNSDVSIRANTVKAAYTLQLLDYDKNLIFSQAVQAGETVDLTTYIVQIQREGYTFNGWEVLEGMNKGTILSGAAADAIAVTADTVLVASGTAENCTLQFDTAGGEPTYIPAMTVPYSTVATLPTTELTREGYTFLGWRDSETGIVYMAGAQYLVKGNAQFVARWEKNDDVIVKFVDEDGHMYDWFFVEDGGLVTAPAAPEKTGFRFLGWENDDYALLAAGGKEQIHGAPGDVVVFTAKWAGADYLLHIQGRNADGTLTAAGNTYEIPDADVATIAAGEQISLTVTPQKNYAMTSVYYTTVMDNVTTKVILEPDANGVYNFKMPAAEAWLHIECTQNVFNVTTKGDGNETVTAVSQNPEDAAGTATVGELVDVAVRPNKNYVIDAVTAKCGNSFVYLTYLSTDEDGTMHYCFTMPAGNVVVTASAVKASYTLQVLDYNNNLILSQAVKAGETVDLTTYIAALARTGYDFEGWFVIAGETPDVLLTGASSESITVNANTILKASYQAQRYTVARADDCSEHLEKLVVSDPRTPSSVDFSTEDNYGMTVASATDNTVSISVKPEFDYTISGLAIRGTDSDTVVQSYLKRFNAMTGVYVYEFTMPAENVEVAVYTEPKSFDVSVIETPGEGGTYTINGYTTTNLPVKQGEDVAIDVQAEQGWYVESYSVYYLNGAGEKVYVLGADGEHLMNIQPGTSEATIAFRMVSYHVTVEVNYAKTAYTVTPDTAAANGQIGVRLADDPNEIVYGTVLDATVGDEVEIGLLPDAGYEVLRDTLQVLDESGSPIAARFVRRDGDTYYYRFTMPSSNVTVSCEFGQKTYRVIADQRYTGGQVWVGDTNSNVATFAKDTTATVTLVPEDGYRVTQISTQVTVGGVARDVIADNFILCDADGNEVYNAVEAAKEAKRQEILEPEGGYVPLYTPILEATAVDTDEGRVYSFLMPEYDVYVTTSFEKVDLGVDVEMTNTANTGKGTVYTGIKASANATSDKNITTHVNDNVYVRVAPEYGYVLKDLVAVYTDAEGDEVELPLTMVSQKYDKHDIYWTSYVARFTMPASSVTVRATFVEDYYAVVFQDWDNTQLQVQNVDYKATPNLSAQFPAVTGRPGYHFVGWSSADVETPVTAPSVDPADFVIVKDTVIRAVYEKDSYSIHYNAGPHGSFADGKTEQAEYLDVCSFTAVPETGYMVDTVSATYVNEAGETIAIELIPGAKTVKDHAGTTAEAYSFRMPACTDDAGVTVSATFKPMTYDVTSQYNKAQGALRLNGEDVDAMAANYTDTISVNVTPATGYMLTQLYYTYTDPLSGDSKQVNLLTNGSQKESRDYTFTMPASDTVVHAVFAQITYKVINDTTDPNGVVTIAKTDVAYLDTATFNVKPNEGYRIDTVTAYYVDELGKDQTITFTDVQPNATTGGVDYSFIMPASDVHIVATFAKLTYLASVNLTGEATVQLDGNYTDALYYDFADTVTITITPASGWEISSVVADGKTLTANADGNYTFTMPAHDVTIDITVIKTGYTVTGVVTGEAAGGTVKPSVSLANVGDVVSAEVTAAYGYDLVNVVVRGESGKVYNVDRVSGNFYFFTMPAENVTVTAEFARHLFTVTFRDYDGKTLKVEEVPYEGAATAPATPAREGYTFLRWDTAFDCVTQDLTVTAIYVINSHGFQTHGISFTGVDHGTVTIANGDTANYGDNVLVKIDPDDGWRVEHVAVVTKAGQSVSVTRISNEADYEQAYTFVMPDDDVIVTVTYTMHSPSQFTDVRTDAWYFEAINFVTDRSYFVGVSDTLFGPEIQMTRAMFVTVLGRVAGIDAGKYTGKSEFTDVAENQYYAPYVKWAAENDIVAGYPEGVFKPDENITREQMAAMMRRFCRYSGMNVSVSNANWMARYADVYAISDWAYEDVCWAVGCGLMRGKSDSTINPLELATRAEVAQVIKNLCDKLIYQ